MAAKLPCQVRYEVQLRNEGSEGKRDNRYEAGNEKSSPDAPADDSFAELRLGHGNDL